jgi:hypothetical protein
MACNCAVAALPDVHTVGGLGAVFYITENQFAGQGGRGG